MNAAQKRNFINLSKRNKNKHPGYVYIGKGRNHPDLSTLLSIQPWDIWMECSNEFTSNNLGNSLDHDYYIKKQVWEMVFGKSESSKSESIESRVILVKELIGKQINFSGNIYTIESTRVYFSYAELEKENWGISKIEEEQYKNQIDIHGNLVCFYAISENGSEYLWLIDSNNLPELYVKPSVKVNGWIAEDKGDYYKFGCAEIDKDDLRAAKTLMQRVAGEQSNRKIESVKIGAGEFTLDILNDLNLD